MRNTPTVFNKGGITGMSGVEEFNANGEVIGVHLKMEQNLAQGLILSPTQLAWIKSIIAGNEIPLVYDELYRLIKMRKKEKLKMKKKLLRN